MTLEIYKEALLPNLNRGEYRVTSPESIRYNCVAWAAGDDARRWWPGVPDYYWPDTAPQEETLEAFQAVFEAMGYRLCATAELETGFEKVAIFSKRRVSYPRRPAVGKRQLEQQIGPLAGH